jgi:gamma-glutamyltranspeptidase/glutathione hydrolase
MAITPMSTTTLAPEGMVCSIDPLASSAGVAMLRAGGTAADAAIAASSVLAVTTPHMCGMGGDLLALVHEDDGPPAALNSSGRAGSGADLERLRSELGDSDDMPYRGDIRSVSVPGCVDGWLALHDRFGTLPMAEVLAPAIGYAASGFPVDPLLAAAWTLVGQLPDAEVALVSDRPVRMGVLATRPGVARSLLAIAAGGRSGFYQGEFGAGLIEVGTGEFEPADLQRPSADWVEPLGARVWDHDVWTMPPNSQGYLTLLTLAIAERCDLPADPTDPDWCHLLVEAARAAGVDRLDRLHESFEAASVLAPDEVSRRAAGIDRTRRQPLPSQPVAGGGTIYLCAVDGERRGVSLIQSNAADFGCHIIEPRTGIFLHNRGIGFSTDPTHPAAYGPGRRPPTTLSPALVTRPDGSFRACVGTMGGDVQPQVVAQLIARLVHGSQSPGTSLDAPRWILRDSRSSGFSLWKPPGPDRVGIETGAPAAWTDAMIERGHQVVELDGAFTGTGHAHIIEAGDDGLAGAAEPRAAGAAVGY